jgi:MOSC domain-containing protein YiiM
MTAIFKEPVEGIVPLRKLNFRGDRQADLSAHGGWSKAVYAYPSEHYEFWCRALPDIKFSWGMFGENLTTEGMLEHAVRIGDRFRIGSAEVMVTEPRLPCYKLGIRFGRNDIIRRFLRSRRTGFYLAVLAEGGVGPGDEVSLLSRDEKALSVADIVRLYAFDKNDMVGLDLAANLNALPESWRTHFQARLERLAARR